MSHAIIGTATIHITNIEAVSAPSTITEVKVVPDFQHMDRANVVLMGFGKSKTRYSLEGWVESADLSTIVGYNVSYNAETMTVYLDGDTFINAPIIIEKLNYKAVAGTPRAQVSMTLISFPTY